jgi:hypothetical protein
MAIKRVKLLASGSYLAPYYAANIHISDTRNTNALPKVGEGKTVWYDFQPVARLPDIGYESGYCIIETIKPWDDNSGGVPTQIAYAKSNADSLPRIYVRASKQDLSSWNSWYEIYHSGNFNVKSVEDKIDDVIDGTLSAYYAQKLKYPRAINLSTAVSATGVQFDGSKDITIPVNSVYADYVSWGNKASITSLTPLDVAYLPGESANRFAGVTADALKFERSSDNGASWTTVTGSVNIFTNSSNFNNGNTTSDKNANRQSRITLDCAAAGLYCNLRNILIYYSTNGATGTYMTLERGDYSSPTVWHTLLDKVNINGWSGWNHYYCNEIIGSDTYGNKTRYLRFTFGCTGVSDTYASNCIVLSIKGISNVCWSNPSDYAANGVPYSVNSTGTALEVTASYPWTFNKPITANSGITGDLTGTAEYANYLNITAGNEIKIAGESTSSDIWMFYRGATSTQKITGVRIGDGTGTGTYSNIYVNKVYLNGTTSTDDIYIKKSEFGDTSKLLYGEVAFEGATWGADYILASSEDFSGRFIAKEKYVRLSILSNSENGIPTAHAVYKYIEDNCVKVSGSLSTFGRIVTVASNTGYINQSSYSINTKVFNDDTQVPTSKAVYDYVTPVLGNIRTASSMVLELTVGGNKDSISISQASANYAGLMTASMYNTMQSLETIDNNYQKKIVEEITGTMGSVGGTLYFNAIATKFVYEGLTKISGSIKISSYSSSTTYKYRIINPATFNSKLSSNFSVTISKFLKGWWWASLKSTSDGSIFGYGTDASIESSSYIGFGRIYSDSGSRGNWAQEVLYNNCANGVLHFEVWFTV